MEKKIIYTIFVFAVLLAVSFAVGGGGGSSPIPSPTIKSDYSCSNQMLTITITSSSDTSLLNAADVKIIESKSGTIVASTSTDAAGQIITKLTDNGKYLVSVNKDGYRSNSAFVFINCEKEQGLEKASNASSNKSAIIQKEPDFYCTEGKTMRERIKCYLKLSVEKIDQVKYVPEECNVNNETKKGKCIELYKLEQTCRTEDKNDSEREACIKPKLKLSVDIKEDLKKCQNLKNETDKSACFLDLKENVYSLVKFRVYNLVYKAEELKSKGADEEKVTDFIVLLNQEKLKFNDAQTIKEKKDILKEIINSWSDFKKSVRTSVKQ